MIKHIALFKLADKAEGLSREENAVKIKLDLEKLKKQIPEIKKIHVHINAETASQRNFDILLDSEFETFDDLATYQMHPEHQKVGAYIAKVKTSRAAIDYEF